MDRRPQLSRSRSIVGLLCLVAFVFSACSSPTPTVAPAATSAPNATAAPADTAAPVSQYHQSPMLDAKVASGELPPVEERLPDNPLVLTTDRNAAPDGSLTLAVGTYGGTMRLVHAYEFGSPMTLFMSSETTLARPGYNLTDPLTPNVMESFSVNDDKTEYTFTIRKGLKWSDGVPVTTEDAQFQYEDVLMNELLQASDPWLSISRAGGQADGNLYKLTVVDEYTFKVTFDKPTPGFLDESNKPWVDSWIFLEPKHYLSQFHIKYADPDELLAKIKDAGFATIDDWPKLYDLKTHHWGSSAPEKIGTPTLWPWVLVNSNTSNNEWERNPYYFKVDEAGNQLPYIDRVVSTRVQDPEAAILKILAGEDYLEDELAPISSLPLFKENEAQGDYSTFLMKTPYNYPVINIDFEAGDANWQTLASDVRFRKALSIGINRQAIIEGVYQGIGEPTTWVPSEFDPDEANRLLDEVGLDQRDADGWRLGLDGKRLELPFEIYEHFPDTVPVMQNVMGDWRELGLFTTVTVVDANLIAQRLAANELLFYPQMDETTTLRTLGHVKFFMFMGNPLYDQWLNSAGDEGKAPPQWFQDVFNAGNAIGPGIPWTQAIDDTYRQAYFDNIPKIPIVDQPIKPIIVSNKLHNVFNEGVGQWLLYAMEQMYLTEQ
jgi:peptide/nickel transport system substrate-binding protein